MLEDTAAKIVLSSNASRLKLPETAAIEIIAIDGDWSLIAKKSKKESAGGHHAGTGGLYHLYIGFNR
jgi:hypothetical protein